MKVADHIQSLVPYKPGKPISETQREFGISKVIKLASNENALGISSRVEEAIARASKDSLFRYPDPSCYELVQQLSRSLGVLPNQIAIGNGSNELIDLLIRIFCEKDDAIVTQQYAFIAYQLCAQACGVKTHAVPVDSKLRLNLNDTLDVVQTNSKVKIVFLPNPNNPTGTLIPSHDLKAFLQKMKAVSPETLVVLDEAYHEYVTSSDYETATSWLGEFSNLLVLRTFSKSFGLAGLRIGYLVGSSASVDYINRVRNPFNVNELAQIAAIAALEDQDFITQVVKLNTQEYLRFAQAFEANKIPYFESHGNFILFETLGEAESIFQNLLREGIILRPVGNYGLKNHLRVSIGTAQENEEAISKILKVLKAAGRIKKEESIQNGNTRGQSHYN